MATPKISIISAHELGPELLRRWEAIQDSRADLSSPYYRAEFTQSVAQARDDVRIAIVESAGRIAGFFPFHRARKACIASVGASLNDYHGLIAEEDLRIDPRQLLRACGGRYFRFNHMPLSQTPFSPFIRQTSSSPVMNLAGGIEQYKDRLRRNRQHKTSSLGIFQSVANMRRRIEREHGPLRFEFQESDPKAYQTLLRLKSRQFARTVGSKHDPLMLSWVRQTLDAVRARQTFAFAGMLSALYAGEKLIACHFGLRSKHLLHYWFPTYDTDYARYSPGSMLIMSIAEQAGAQEMTMIDFGKGNHFYKQRFCTSLVPLGDGAVSSPAWIADAVMTKENLRKNLKTSFIGDIWRARKRFFYA